MGDGAKLGGLWKRRERWGMAIAKPPKMRLILVKVALSLFRGTDVERPAYLVPYVLLLVAVIVGVDVLFFRHRFWERLIVNIGIVLVFAAFYLRFLKR
jgi:hypothetical protein